MMEGHLKEAYAPVGAAFPPTRWSVVEAAARGGDAGSDRAMEALCRSYWRPLHAFLRARGFSGSDAEDLTQGFFLRIIGQGLLARYDGKKGRFRTFLLAALKNYASDEFDRARAQKRGGAASHVEFSEAVERDLVGDGEEAPDDAFDRAWALAVLELAGRRLREEYGDAGKAELCETLGPDVSFQAPTGGYIALAGKLGITVGAAKSAAFRLRQRYGQIVRGVVRETVGDAAETDDELRYLIGLLRGDTL